MLQKSEARPFASVILVMAIFGVSQILAACSMLLIVRSLDPAAYGRFSFALAVQSYMAILGGLGLRALLIRNIAREPSSLGGYLRLHWSLMPWTGLLACMLGTCVWYMVGYRTWPELRMFAILALGTWASIVSLTPFLDGLKRHSVSVAIVLLGELTSLSLLLMHPRDVDWVCTVYGIKWVITSLATIVSFRSYPVARSPVASHAPNLIKEGFPLMATNFVLSWPITGPLLLGRLKLTEDELAPIGLGVQVATGFLMMASLASRQVQAEVLCGEDLTHVNTWKRLRPLLVLLVAQWLLLALVTNYLVYFALDASYRNSSIAINMYLVAGFVSGWSYIATSMLTACGKSRHVLVSYTAGAMCVVGQALLIPDKFMVATSLAIVACCSSCVNIALQVFFLNKN